MRTNIKRIPALNGKRESYQLTIGGMRHGLTEHEAALLLHQLLVSLPTVPVPSKQIISGDTKRVAVAIWKAVDGVVVVSHYKLELHSGGEVLYIGEDMTLPEGYEVRERLDSSYHKADNDATMQLAIAYCKRMGISMKELLDQAKGEATNAAQ